MMFAATLSQNSGTQADLKQSIEMYEEACEGWKQKKDSLGVCKCLLQIAVSYMKMDKKVDAKKYAVMAKDLYVKNHASNVAAEAQDSAYAWESALAQLFMQIIPDYYENKIRVTIESNLNGSKDASSSLHENLWKRNADDIMQQFNLSQIFWFRHSCCVQCKTLLNLDQKKRCARCRNAIYCSKECQNKHWILHKILCKAGQKTDNLVQQMNDTQALWKSRYISCVAHFK